MEQAKTVTRRQSQEVELEMLEDREVISQLPTLAPLPRTLEIKARRASAEPSTTKRLSLVLDGFEPNESTDDVPLAEGYASDRPRRTSRVVGRHG